MTFQRGSTLDDAQLAKVVLGIYLVFYKVRCMQQRVFYHKPTDRGLNNLHTNSERHVLNFSNSYSVMETIRRTNVLGTAVDSDLIAKS